MLSGCISTWFWTFLRCTSVIASGGVVTGRDAGTEGMTGHGLVAGRATAYQS
jgi:hypothetical protein